ncbi:hypothetical protein M422DRAFT_277085 [Sphaerobolus stellatus SS14]|uniref:Uncharacterized protein n=1 Tax=Sphaerobolus stellatus (strain SS14) TaxID=990650 RepID=A0A0C9T166_SPHS4|nr:hypothetical protein M422DRAFT_277085 [Sphaerobolus stellatus SS14]
MSIPSSSTFNALGSPQRSHSSVSSFLVSAVPLLRTLELLFDPTTICYANNFTVLVLKVSYLATFGFT